MHRGIALFALVLHVAGCGDGLTATDDASAADAAGRDAVTVDAGTGDAVQIDGADGAPLVDAADDATIVDAAADAADIDATLVDAHVIDGAPVDAQVIDGAPVDALPPDAAIDAALPPLGGFVVGVAHDTDNRTSQLVRIPLDGGPALELTPGDIQVWDFVRSPDGSLLVFRGAIAGTAALYAVRTDGSGAPYRLVPMSQDPVSEYAFSPAGDRVAFSAHTGGGYGLFTVRPDGSDLVPVSGAHDISDWAWRPGSDRLWFRDTTNPGFGSLVEACGDGDCRRVIDADDSVTQFVFAPDGAHVAWTRLVANGPRETLTLMDLASEQRVEVATGRSYGPLIWSPDAARLAFTAVTAVGDRWPMTPHVVRADGTDLVTLTTPFPATDHVVDWSPNSRYLLTFMQRGTGTTSTFHLFAFCADGSCRDDLDVPADHWGVAEAWSNDSRVVHRVLVPGHPAGVLVADCPQAACARARASGDELVYTAPIWAPTSTAYAFVSQRGTWVAESLDAPPLRVSPFPSQVLRFDAAGTRVLVFRDGSVHALRVDGSEDRNLDLQLAGQTLSSYTLQVF